MNNQEILRSIKKTYKQREDAINCLEDLIDLYVKNQGSQGEFITCITPPSSCEMTKKQRKESKTWSVWDRACEIISRE